MIDEVLVNVCVFEGDMVYMDYVFGIVSAMKVVK